ncbi:MAG: PBP1A family penicillin-binding protein [Candidatus Vogelbacteria bacterium]|nr:PBP1A family penicillin-binding protein [Candidatus Vogelbacteria bacterium]
MLKKLLLVILTIGLFGAGAGALWLVNLKLPDFKSLDDRLVTESTRIYDRTGEILLYNAEENIRRRLVPAEDISKHLKNATVAIEDDEFYEHRGVKLDAMFRAFFVNLGAGAVKQGGSTITQQLIKNSLLTQDRKLTRKVKEIFLALKLERIMSKEEILVWYLNEAPYGGQLYGVEEASRTFFNHSAREVTLAEAAYLAAIPKAPTHYSPYGQYRTELEARKDLVLKRMLELNFINQNEFAAAMTETVTFQAPVSAGLKAPHFVMWVLDYLEEKYGRSVIRTRGLKITTTLNWEVQQLAEAAITAYAADNEKNFNAKNAGLVALDPKTGEVLAMVGSRDYFNQAQEGNFNITLAHRQPGSAFKPFVYATAFNKGYTPETMLFDLATQFDVNCPTDPSRCYTPTNYDDRYRGPVSLRQALAGSINIPSIKTLYLAGLADSLETARQMGISGLSDPNRYGLTLVLGGGEVSLLELTSAYGVFANDGIRNPPVKILKVADRQGQIIEQFVSDSRRALAANTARLISEILSDDEARAPIFGPNSLLNFPGRAVAVKTGTTNDYRDAWIVGYSPNLVAGAWVGNNDNTPMEKKVAGLIVAPLWRRFFASALDRLPNEKFIAPEPTSGELPPVFRGFSNGGKSYFIDKVSGKLATEFTPPNLKQERVVKQIHSILYWLNRLNDPQFLLWEEPIRRWAAQNGIVEETEAVIPQALDDVHGSEFAPRATIVLADPAMTYHSGDRVVVNLEIQTSRFPVARADFFLNDNFLGSRRGAPFTFTFSPNEVGEFSQETNELKAVIYDSVDNQSSASVPIKIVDPVRNEASNEVD